MFVPFKTFRYIILKSLKNFTAGISVLLIKMLIEKGLFLLMVRNLHFVDLNQVFLFLAIREYFVL